MTDSSYPLQSWNRYARSHATVTTSFQLALFREAAQALGGDVLDCGCGTARIAPFLADRSEVNSYTGVDLSPEMVEMARWIVARLNRKGFAVVHSAIEAVTGHYGSSVSIHSYYTWPNPLAVLAQIHRVLLQGGLFVLATPNERLDMKRLLRESRMELPAHPDFDEFARLNMELADNPAARFVPMDRLVELVREVGFGILECHQRHFLGGVNFLLIAKRE